MDANMSTDPKSKLSAAEDAIAETDNPKNLICVHTNGPKDGYTALREYLPNIDSKLNLIRISNAYYNCSAHICFVSDRDEKNTEKLLLSCSCVLVIAPSSQDIEACKLWWEDMRKCVSEDCVRLFCATDPSLLAWAVKSDTELVCPDICAEDGLSPWERVRDALDCAPWKHKSMNRGTSQNMDLSAPTRLRKGLDQQDIAAITDELLRLEDSISDSVSESE